MKEGRSRAPRFLSKKNEALSVIELPATVLMTFSKGDLLLTNYTAKVKDTGEVIETTSEGEAKKFGIVDSERRYGPRLVGVGEGGVLAGLESGVRKFGGRAGRGVPSTAPQALAGTE